MQQGPYIHPSSSSFSVDQSKQSDSPYGKTTPAVFFPLIHNRHFLAEFWKCQMAVSILPHEAKTLLDYFAFDQSYLAKGKIFQVVLLPHDAK